MSTHLKWKELLFSLNNEMTTEELRTLCLLFDIPECAVETPMELFLNIGVAEGANLAEECRILIENFLLIERHDLVKRVNKFLSSPNSYRGEGVTVIARGIEERAYMDDVHESNDQFENVAVSDFDEFRRQQPSKSSSSSISSSSKQKSSLSKSVKTTKETENRTKSTISNETYDLSFATGVCIIINNTFRHSVFAIDGCELSERPNARIDQLRLTKTFHSLNFTVESFRNKSVDEMREIILQMVALHDGSSSCFVCCILSRGYNGGVYGSQGGLLPLQEIADVVKANSFKGRPKLFIVQASQQRRNFACIDAWDLKLPAADMLFSVAANPGRQAIVDGTSGSWFIEELCNALDEHSRDKHFLSILDIAAKKLSDRKQEASQEPIRISNLTKLLFFNPKKGFAGN